MPAEPPLSPFPKLLLTPREAAAAMGICEKTLWSLTVPRGELPAVRIGRSVRYSVDDLHRFIAERAGGGR
ncbi:MAG: helix-turn-helix domain-containing protein [Phycisphaerae bacterium]|nr:helix-turn-helix domain-containing protein [Phycisphaerae bacterium]